MPIQPWKNFHHVAHINLKGSLFFFCRIQVHKKMTGARIRRIYWEQIRKVSTCFNSMWTGTISTSTHFAETTMSALLASFHLYRNMHVFQIAQFFRSTRDVCRNWSLYSSTRERSILPETAQLNVFNSWSMRRESTLFLECFVNNGWVRITLVLFAARRSFTSSPSMQVCSALKVLKASNLQISNVPGTLSSTSMCHRHNTVYVRGMVIPSSLRMLGIYIYKRDRRSPLFLTTWIDDNPTPIPAAYPSFDNGTHGYLLTWKPPLEHSLASSGYVACAVRSVPSVATTFSVLSCLTCGLQNSTCIQLWTVPNTRQRSRSSSTNK